jgi:hypothetical protein
VGAIVLGVAIARTDPALKWVGVGFAASVLVFVLLGLMTLDIVQPIGAAALALVGGLRLWRRPRGAATSRQRFRRRPMLAASRQGPHPRPRIDRARHGQRSPAQSRGMSASSWLGSTYIVR